MKFSPHIEISEKISRIATMVENGEMDVLEAAIDLRRERETMEGHIDSIKGFEAQYYNEIQAESEKYQNQYNGYKFEFRNGRKTYDFKRIPEWTEAEKTKKEIEAKYKSMLNAKIKGAIHANVSEDGEELPLPEIKYAKSSLIIKPLKG